MSSRLSALCWLQIVSLLSDGLWQTIIGTINASLYITGKITESQYQWQRYPLSALLFAAAFALYLLKGIYEKRHEEP